MTKSQKLAKSGKKLSKSGNLSNFNIKENRLSFLTTNARMAFNCLGLALIKALILQHFDSEYHIWIEIDALDYAIDNILNLLASQTMLDGVFIKTNLSQ